MMPRELLGTFQAQPSLAVTPGVNAAMSSGSGFGTGSGSGRGDRGDDPWTPASSRSPEIEDQTTSYSPPRPERDARPSGQERTVSYQPEERYWTDYLRVALPVVGLLLMLGLFLFWANQLINPDEDPPTPAAVVIDDAAGTEVIEAASPVATPTSAPDLAVNPPADNGAGAPTTPPDQNATLPTATTAPPADDAAGDQPADTNDETSADGDTATDGGFAIDDTVRVTEDGVNLRSATSTESSDNIVGTLNEGDLVQIIGGPEQAGGYTWYQVRLEEADGSVVEGWVAGSFLEAA